MLKDRSPALAPSRLNTSGVLLRVVVLSGGTAKGPMSSHVDAGHGGLVDLDKVRVFSLRLNDTAGSLLQHATIYDNDSLPWPMAVCGLCAS